MNLRSLALPALAIGILTGGPALRGASPEPVTNPRTAPPGFTALWNGRDLAGWWGATTEDPAKYLALPAAEFQQKRAASLADIRQHWSLRDGELANDGQGLFLTTGENYGDFELQLKATKGQSLCGDLC